MIYVDAPVWPHRGMLMCHMISEDLEELHAFAASLGLQRAWFQEPPKASCPHYDVSASKRELAVRMGAVEIDRKQLVEITRRIRLAHGVGRRP